MDVIGGVCRGYRVAKREHLLFVGDIGNERRDLGAGRRGLLAERLGLGHRVLGTSHMAT